MRLLNKYLIKKIYIKNFKSKEHLVASELAYIELSGLYGWIYINCIKDKKIRTIEDINEEILNKILKLIEE